jgi:hypothetical protein
MWIDELEKHTTMVQRRVPKFRDLAPLMKFKTPGAERAEAAAGGGVDDR